MTSEFEKVELSLPQGRIKGVKRASIYDDYYFSFEAIPYARPPIGELRFLSPQPAEPWEGVRDCTKHASRAVQKNNMTGITSGSEDCLYLNVYAQTLKSDKPLPVMVWIHGGGFCHGEGTPVLYAPDYFMSQPVVLVTLNYRVCSLGFLKLKDPEVKVPGNAGLKDQVLALKWVKDNIQHFNGDPHSITLFGESAGGASVHYLMLTPRTEGLYQKAIVQSGCVLNDWACMPLEDMAYRLARYHGYTGDNADKLVLHYLQALEPEKLVNHTLLIEKERRNGWLFDFGPTVEAYVSDDCIVPIEPIQMLPKAWTNNLPIMIGGTSFEGLLMYYRLKMFPQMMNTFKNDPERILPKDARDGHTPDENTQLARRLTELHFGRRQPNDECRNEFLDLYSYKMFWHGLHRVVLSRLAHATKAATFLYRFDYDSPDFNYWRTKFCGTDPVRGVSHADDLCYLFFSDDGWKLAPESGEFKTIQRMIALWTAFARNSDPNCALIKPVVWPPLTAENPHHALNISEELEMMDMPEKDKLNIWNSIYAEGTLF